MLKTHMLTLFLVYFLALSDYSIDHDHLPMEVASQVNEEQRTQL